MLISSTWATPLKPCLLEWVLPRPRHAATVPLRSLGISGSNCSHPLALRPHAAAFRHPLLLCEFSHTSATTISKPKLLTVKLTGNIDHHGLVWSSSIGCRAVSARESLPCPSQNFRSLTRLLACEPTVPPTHTGDRGHGTDTITSSSSIFPKRQSLEWLTMVLWTYPRRKARWLLALARKSTIQ